MNTQTAYSQEVLVRKYKTFDLQTNTSIRALEVINDSTMWFAGSHGIIGHTEDNGKHWLIDSIKIDTLVPEFRSMAVTNDHTILLLSIGSPAYLLKSTDKGKTWRRVYENLDPNIFFDSMKFTDEKEGIAVADPIDGYFAVLVTHDSGESWHLVNKNAQPKATPGEACFASSNTSIDADKSNLWIATGGIGARVLHSHTPYDTWSYYRTPIQNGSALTGIFSIDFYDEQTGFAVGGNYEEKKRTDSTGAITIDGGKTWRLIPPGEIPFGSCVQFRPFSKGKIIFISCLPGIYFSTNQGNSWSRLKDETGNEITESFFTFRFSPSGKVAWFAGANGKLARVELK